MNACLHRYFVAVALAAIIMAGCGHVKPTPPTPGPGDATCADACVHMQTLGCRAGNPTVKGEPCEAVCTNVMTSGIVIWDLRCMSTASDCRGVNACNP